MGSLVTPRAAIVGCGLIGQKRAKALAGARLTACADVQRERAESLARPSGAFVSTDWREVVVRDDVDIVVVSTMNDSLAEITAAAVRAAKHVLVEKPGARSVSELDEVIAAAASAERLVRVGFNHRYHPAMQRARALVDAGEAGELMFV